MLQFQGEHAFSVSRPELWAKLTDLQFLVKCIPDVARVNEVKERTASLVLKPGFSFVRGELQLTIEKIEEKPPETAKLAIKTKGIGTSSEVEASFQLAERAGGSQLNWSAEVKHLGGLLKAVPHGLVQAAARKVIDDVVAGLAANL